MHKGKCILTILLDFGTSVDNELYPDLFVASCHFLRLLPSYKRIDSLLYCLVGLVRLRRLVVL